MKRDIIFRGKRTDNGEWVYGDLIHTLGGYPLICTKHVFGAPAEVFEVDYATVGQYTGLTDKDGNKIFEGDILKFYQKTAYVIFRTGEFCAVDNNNTGYCIVQSACEVVGNVHDSPELLEGGEE